MLRVFLCLMCALSISVFFTGSLQAREPSAGLSSRTCCPHCGSENAVGNEVAGVCLDCGQATVLGLSVPLATFIGSVLVVLSVVAGSLVAHRLRGRGRRLPALRGSPQAAPWLRTALGALLALAVFSSPLLAADVIKATVVSYDKETMKLVVKAGDKERTIELKKNIHVHDVDDKEVKVKDRPEKLKKDVKIEIEEEKGKVVEINIKN